LLAGLLRFTEKKLAKLRFPCPIFTMPLPKPRIFISHSAHEPAARNALDQLVAGLEPSFKVLFDRGELIAGDEWRDKVFALMQQAHSAIILFSSSALASDWVRTEASVLTWRQTLDRGKSFKVIPVLLDPVKRTDLEDKKFAPLRLTTLQLVRTDDPAQIVREVITGLRHLTVAPPPETPLEKLERKIAFLLREIKEAELLEAARAMDVDVSEWNESSEYPMLLAGEMLRRGLPSASSALRELSDFLGPDNTSTLIELIAPVWVSLHAASHIPRIATREDTAARLISVNGGDEYPDFTASHFIRRACCRTPSTCWPILPVPNQSGEDEVGYYKRTIRELIKTKVVKVEGAKDSLIQSVLKNRERDQEPIFIVFYPPGPPPEVSAALRTEFPTVTFFVLTGSQSSSGAARLPEGVELLEPKLNPGEEETAFSEYTTAKGYGL
jgi:hypothetical protein